MHMERTMQGTERSERTAALAQLGRVMGALAEGRPWPGHGCGLLEDEYGRLDDLVRTAHRANGWFTEANVRHAFGAWAQALEPTAIAQWLAKYPELDQPRAMVRTVGLVLAGNIPLVGLHDVLCVWLAGHKARVKCSSQDPMLIPALFQALDKFHPGTARQVEFLRDELGRVDAVIATGSNNTARYFEHYFGHLPRIVRKSRVSVAVLDGHETANELAALGEDIFRHFGLGCRNVSKLYVSQDFELDRFFEAIFPWNEIVNHNKYGNNYDYTRALWLLDGVKFLDNGFMLLREDAALASPVSAVHYERYTDGASVNAALEAAREGIQCVVGHGHLPFGTAQLPGLGDYADGVDTMAFLLGLG
jgi:hypothetical protein